MPATTFEWIGAAAELGTAVAAIIALVALIITILSMRAERVAAAASDIRWHMTALAQESQVLAPLLNDGSPLILAAANICRELQERLPADTPVDQLGARLAADQPMVLSAAIAGWNRSELSRRLDELQDNLRRARVRLTGQLSLLRYPTELYDALANDGYSAMIFMRLLESPQLTAILLADHQDARSLAEALNGLAGGLQSNASLYFSTRYQHAARHIDSFIQLATQALGGLDDKTLVELSQASTRDADEKQTRTGAMRAVLASIQGRIGREHYRALSELLDAIEVSVSKKAAEEQLARHEASKTSPAGP